MLKDIVLVFDKSRSMAGDLLKQAKLAVKAVMHTLTPNDRVRPLCLFCQLHLKTLSRDT